MTVERSNVPDAAAVREQLERILASSHFAAAPGQDALLLGLAYQLERARPWQNRWAPYSFPVLFGAD